MQNVQKVLRRCRETERKRERGRHSNDCFLVIERDRERENKMAQRLYLNPG